MFSNIHGLTVERKTSQLIMEHYIGCSEDLPAVVAVPASVASAA